MFPAKIYVTEEDIKNGEVYSSDRCPIALAITRCINRPGVKVGSLRAIDDEYQYHLFGPEITQWIVNFDRGKSVEPFSFELCWQGYRDLEKEKGWVKSC